MLFRSHDFGYWQMDLARARFIAGFGKICWLEGGEVLRDPRGAGMGEAAPQVVAHMNEDHEEALLAMCRAFRRLSARRARMVEVDRAGFLVRTGEPERLLHFSFGREISAADARAAFVDLARRARAAAPPTTGG